MISLSGQVLAITKAPAGFSLDPSLAVAVLRVLDVLTRVEQGVAVKAIVDVPCMGNIASCNDPHEAIVLPNPHLSSICCSRSSG